MRVIYSEDHKLRDARTELYAGQLVTPFEAPFRAEWILAAVKEAGFADVVAPDAHGLETANKVHDPAYLDFLATVWDRWVAAGFKGEAIANSFPVRRTSQRVPDNIVGAIGHYANAADTSITNGSYEAAIASMRCAITGADWLAEDHRFAFALCRPPGHHAGIDLFGGYCFINNAGVAAQRLLDHGAAKVAVLDVDFHHGNGTQDLFYHRGDVFTASLHGDPMHAFPYFLGHAEEEGEGAGTGTNRNYPMPPGTPFEVWSSALADALARIKAFGAEAIVVALGVDTFERDPISFFRLTSDDFIRMGAMISAAGLPVLACMEGGYGVPEIGRNVANVLKGLEA
ncbi:MULTISPECIES: histone deacetylase family protein [Rhizobium]|uniref:Histone deacetylase family protein n=2 Tax=Rhizobium TaxID=379 RepID=A0A2A5KUQ4_9HYPH|nr:MULTISPECIES: histone deacetylase family protein [Rhizobium]UWU34657.1 histone deacetylase family protein [Rhizobium leguminosarum bv. phaseoli]AIC25443.1 acetylpolyamine aminohydrolase [Rhizobium sp. IE4771]ARQ56387.1 acetylpolyamine aminohydrolase [Rhizobium sp. Kim5]PCK80715.1 histone deacetylase family protein [Rhizobium sophoriradicis]RSB92514.1 histone deacetylase family protein [Rhizobium sophoriradicis]